MNGTRSTTLITTTSLVVAATALLAVLASVQVVGFHHLAIALASCVGVLANARGAAAAEALRSKKPLRRFSGQPAL